MMKIPRATLSVWTERPATQPDVIFQCTAMIEQIKNSPVALFEQVRANDIVCQNLIFDPAGAMLISRDNPISSVRAVRQDILDAVKILFGRKKIKQVETKTLIVAPNYYVSATERMAPEGEVRCRVMVANNIPERESMDFCYFYRPIVNYDTLLADKAAHFSADTIVIKSLKAMSITTNKVFNVENEEGSFTLKHDFDTPHSFTPRFL
ncbi:hypothetical protein [Pantoea cypripedii]|uniref:Uncharacterized protein n=1 Tax=Pantoea cypripedii TaxID=55209 RepID=A0A1X1EWB8_PANCY|nr:hypothetical protein [Pantoea cypripedii]MBP2198411.1 hypothetical protein [Pantoea cypripedii]ORM94221.1 hypothetical protein HA50_12990 [Pantoea cypripedii]